jgi:1-phosphatidylinositol-4-phosphate 5-kinase
MPRCVYVITGCLGSCRRLRLGPSGRAELLECLRQDVDWLRAHNIMDYSLLVGVASLVAQAPPPTTGTSAGAGAAAGTLPDSEAACRRLYSLWAPQGAGVGAGVGDGGHYEHVLFLGIVDVLQEYNLKKRVETMYKTGLYSFEGKDPRGLSVVDPASYGKRFLAFIEQHLE